MRAGRYAPLVVGTLLVFRVVSCGGGREERNRTTGRGATVFASGPTASCENGDVSYTSAGQPQDASLSEQGLWVDSSTGSAACTNSGPGMFRSAPASQPRTVSIPNTARRRAPPRRFFSGRPSARKRVCDWTTQMTQPCAGAMRCYQVGCTTGAAGGSAGGSTSGGSHGRAGEAPEVRAERVAPLEPAAPAPAAACSSGDVSYTSGGQRLTHTCPNKDCWIDVSTGSAACTNSGPGVIPFRTCLSSEDCLDTKYCATASATSEVLLRAAVCTEGVCDWTTQMTQPCAGAMRCYQVGCTTAAAGGSAGGSTSGGFPWTGQGGTGGASAKGGAGGGGGAAGAAGN